MSQDTFISSHKTAYPIPGYLSNRSTDVHWTETALLVPLNEALLSFPVDTESLCSHAPQELWFISHSFSFMYFFYDPWPMNSFAHSQDHNEKPCSSGQNNGTRNYSNALTTQFSREISKPTVATITSQKTVTPRFMSTSLRMASVPRQITEQYP